MCYSSLLFAEDLSMSEVLVTGSKVDVKASNSTERVEVFNIEDIERSGATTAEDYLNTLPGITVYKHPSFQVKINGMDGRYTKILMDGIPLNGDVGGAFPIEAISLSNVAKIEILKGASSALYGSDAMGGVINFISKKPDELHPISGDIRYRYGSNITSSKWDSPGFAEIDNMVVSDGDERSHWSGEHDGAITLNHSNKFFNIGLTGGFLHNSGVVDTIEPYILKKYEYLGMSSNDRYNGRLAFRSYLGDRQDISGGVSLSSNESNISPTFSQRSTMGDKRYAADLAYNFVISEKNALKAWVTAQKHDHIYQLWDYDFETFQKDKVNSYKTVESEISTSYQPNGSHTIIVGITGKFESVEGEDLGNEEKRGQEIALFAQDLWNVKGSEKLIVTPGARYTYNSRYEGNFSPTIGLRYNVADPFFLRLSTGTGFKAPTFKNNYYVFIHPKPSNFILMGNPDLEAETSINVNGSVGISPTQSLSFVASGHYTKFDGQIITIPVSDSTGFHDGYGEFNGLREYVNLSESYSTGADIQVGWTPSNWFTMHASYLYLKQMEMSEGTYVETLGYSPHEIKGNATFTIASMGVNATSITPTFTWLSSELVDHDPKQSNPAYHMLDLTIQQPIRSWVSLTLAAKNLTDNVDEIHGLGYGRTVSLAVKASIPAKK